MRDINIELARKLSCDRHFPWGDRTRGQTSGLDGWTFDG